MGRGSGKEKSRATSRGCAKRVAWPCGPSVLAAIPGLRRPCPPASKRKLIRLGSCPPRGRPMPPPDDADTRRDPQDHLLHVRVPLRHPRPPARRRGPLHRRQPRPPDQQGRDLRQGLVGHHEAVFAGAADAAAAAQGRAPSAAPASSSRSPGTRRSRCSKSASRRSAPTDPKKFALFTGRDQMQALTGLVRAPVRHAQLRGARRLLLGEHGRRHDLHDRRLVLGVRRPRSRSRAKLFVMIGTAEDHHSQSAQDRDLEVQARRRPLHLDQSGAHRLFGDRRRVGADSPGHRRRAAARAHPRAHRHRPVRPRISSCATPTPASS